MTGFLAPGSWPCFGLSDRLFHGRSKVSDRQTARGDRVRVPHVHSFSRTVQLMCARYRVGRTGRASLLLDRDRRASRMAAVPNGCWVAHDIRRVTRVVLAVVRLRGVSSCYTGGHRVLDTRSRRAPTHAPVVLHGAPRFVHGYVVRF